MQQDLIQQRLDAKAHRQDVISKLIPYMGLAVLIVFFTVVTGGMLLSPTNLSNLVNQCFTLVMVSIGGAFVYAHGGSDMSIAATCGCGQLAAAYLITQMGMPLWVAILACIAVTVLGSCMTASIGLIFSVPVFIGWCSGGWI